MDADCGGRQHHLALGAKGPQVCVDLSEQIGG